MWRFGTLVAALGLAVLLCSPVAAQQSPTSPGQRGGQTQGQKGNTGTPWYYNPDVRQQLKLTDQQFKQLGEAYDKTWGRYKNEFGKLDTLNEKERGARMQELNRTMNADLFKAFGDVMNEQQMNRFRQLDLQYRGFGAFSDPEVGKKLNLTDEQAKRLRELGQTSEQEMRQQFKDAKFDDQKTMERYNTWRKGVWDKAGEILNEQQRQAWTEMTGPIYNFRPDINRPGQSGSGKQDK